MDIVKHGLVDENQKVKTITALTVSALAEAAAPYGIESFDDVLEPLWKGIRLLRGKARTRLIILWSACCEPKMLSCRILRIGPGLKLCIFS